MEFDRKLEQAGSNPFVIWRKAQGLTKIEFARVLDVPYSTIYKLEAGHYGVTLTDHLKHKILAAGLPVDQLLPAYMKWRRGILPSPSRTPKEEPGDNQN